jgi:hypothetical protein
MHQCSHYKIKQKNKHNVRLRDFRDAYKNEQERERQSKKY